MLEKQPGNRVHTSITKESVKISSAQVLFGEKCTSMNAGSVESRKIIPWRKSQASIYCPVLKMITLNLKSLIFSRGGGT